MKSSFTVSEKALAASYPVAKLIAQQKKPHTIGEKLLQPACLEIVRLMLWKEEVEGSKKRHSPHRLLKGELMICLVIFLKL